MENIVFEIEEDEKNGGFIAEAKLPNNEQIITEGDTIEELREMIKDALACHFEDSEFKPKNVTLQFLRKEVLVI